MRYSELKFIFSAPNFILTLILFFCMVGCSSISPKKISTNQQGPQHEILFIKEHWHTSIVLEAPLLLAVMPELKANLQSHPYVRVGWGDGDYFTGKNKSNFSATRALFLSGYSAMQVLDYDDWPITDFDEASRVSLQLANADLDKLIQFIRRSFYFNEEGSLMPLQAFREGTGSFFVAKEHYSVFNNCNSWSANALKSAGLPIGFHLTPSGVLADAKKIARQQNQQEQDCKKI